MDGKRYLMLCLFTLAGAFAGGYAAGTAAPVAHAQDILPPGEVRGTSFVLTGPQGQEVATLRSGPFGADLSLNDPQGKMRVELRASGGIVIRDAQGRIEWRSPHGGNGIMPLREQ